MVKQRTLNSPFGRSNRLSSTYDRRVNSAGAGGGLKNLSAVTRRGSIPPPSVHNNIIPEWSRRITVIKIIYIIILCRNSLLLFFKKEVSHGKWN